MSILSEGLSTIISTTEFNKCKELATIRANKYAKVKGPYKTNSVNSHVIGCIGEFAVEKIFNGLGANIENLCEDLHNDHLCDIIINNKRVEIKCWRPQDFNSYGACIAQRQANNIMKKADIIIYTVWNRCNQTVSIVGYNYTKDIIGLQMTYTGPKSRPIANYVMPIRSLEELSKALAAK